MDDEDDIKKKIRELVENNRDKNGFPFDKLENMTGKEFADFVTTKSKDILLYAFTDPVVTALTIAITKMFLTNLASSAPDGKGQEAVAAILKVAQHLFETFQARQERTSNKVSEFMN